MFYSLFFRMRNDGSQCQEAVDGKPEEATCNSIFEEHFNPSVSPGRGDDVSVVSMD